LLITSDNPLQADGAGEDPTKSLSPGISAALIASRTSAGDLSDAIKKAELLKRAHLGLSLISFVTFAELRSGLLKSYTIIIT
jgi:hypothetical protein